MRNSKLHIAVIFALSCFFLLHQCDYQLDRPEVIPGKNSEFLAEKESCALCHNEVMGLSKYHDPKEIGCTPCHGGDPYSSNKKFAHEGLILIPGNLSDVSQTCGTEACHSVIANRVQNSLMTTLSGMINYNSFVFGEQESVDSFHHVENLTDRTAVNVHLRQLCVSCHLGNEKSEFGPITEKSRGGGCNACHLNYSNEAIADHLKYAELKHLDTSFYHPTLNLDITNDHCFGCHSRSARISTNYEGWHETQLTENDISNPSDYRILEDGRVFKFVAEDIHHAAGMDCIDCHSSSEIMGNGELYPHSSISPTIQCIDCHRTSQAPLTNYEDLDDESKKLISLRKLESTEKKYVVQSEGMIPMYNLTFFNDDSLELISKNTSNIHFAKKPAEQCTKGTAHDRLSCQACHTNWIPQCIGCHNSFEPKSYAFDHLNKERVKGKWVEYRGEFFAEEPALGIVEKLDTNNNLVGSVKPFMSGMILSIDLQSFTQNSKDSLIFYRLFAPVDPHTTTLNVRSCNSCHNNPLALGYGRGVMNYSNHSWSFSPTYEALEYDGLPTDAWIGFLKEENRMNTISKNNRAFNLLEQKRVLTVGACLSCHEGNSNEMLSALINFDNTIDRMTSKCSRPIWDDSIK